MRHHQAGNLATAERLYKKLLEREARNPEVWYLAGYLAIQRGEHVVALHRLTRTLALRPDFPEAELNRANLLMEMGRIEEAIAAWRKVLAANPDRIEAHGNLAIALARLGRHAEALGHRFEAARAAKDGAALIALARDAAVLLAVPLALAAAEAACALRPDDGEAAAMLADLLRALGRLDEAETAARRATALAPGLAAGFNALGQILFRTDRPDEALAALEQACAIDPGHLEARHFRSLLNRTDDHDAQAGYVRALFDECADSFETILVDHLHYDAPAQLARQLEALGALAARPEVVDLGCGTGLCGDYLRAAASRLVGVDLAPRMVERTRQRGIYDEVAEADIVDFLGRHPQAFDGAIAADVLIYIGEAAEVFTAAHRALRPGGWFAFSIETNDKIGETNDESSETGDRAGVIGRASGRYAHGLGYIRDLAARTGFIVADERPFALRQELGASIPGCGIVLIAR